MSMPFYVSPEQLMKDRADFARKGIARGRSVAVVRYADGILFVSENPSAGAAQGQRDLRPDRLRGGRPLQRVREPPDRRRPPGRHARLLLRPPRRDRPGLANAYAQTLGTIFSTGGEKPYEVEIFVAEVGDAAERRPGLPAHLRRPGRRGARLRRDGRRGRLGHDVPPGALQPRAVAATRRCGSTVAALGHNDSGDRDDPGRRPRGGGPGPHPLPGAQVPAAAGRGARPAARAPAEPRRSRAGPAATPEPARSPAPTGALDLARRGTARRALSRLPTPPHRVGVWTGESSGSRTSTASRARSRGSGGCRPTRSPATCSARWSAGAAAATSSWPTAPGSTSTSAATRSTPPPSATTSSTWSPTTRRGSGSSRACSSTPSGGCATRASPATSTCSRTTPTRPATPTAATRTTWSAGTASSAGSPTC